MGGFGQAGQRVDVAGQEIACQQDERPVIALEEFEVAMPVVVLPERKENQPCLVLLDRILRFAGGIHPGMPAAAGITGRRVFVPEVSLSGDDPGAELEEASWQVNGPGLAPGIDGK